MVQYAQDGRRVYRAHDHHNEGVYMVENVGGVDEPYMGDLADLRVSMSHVSKLSPAELERLQEKPKFGSVATDVLHDQLSAAMVNCVRSAVRDGSRFTLDDISKILLLAAVHASGEITKKAKVG